MVPSELNDIWGWVDSAGNEYAIVGMNDGTSIINLSDPLSPQEVLFVPGMNSIWRDIKTYGNYAYVTTEAMNGLLIIDLYKVILFPKILFLNLFLEYKL